MMPAPEVPLTAHFFTVDVEEHFQVRALESAVRRDDWHSYPSRVGRSVDMLLECLERHEAKGTFFVLGWLADHHPEVVRAIAAAGHEVASHGYWHDPVTTLSAVQFRADVRAAKIALENVTGEAVIGYRAPNFSITPGREWAFDILLEEGHKYDSSLFPVVRPDYGYPGIPRDPHQITTASGTIVEFPLATTRFLNYNLPAAGGGYLRHFPLSVVRRALREAMNRGKPATFYIHPWEVDAEQPRLPVSTINRVRHYRGLGRALSRIEQLLREFRFTAIGPSLSRFTSGSAVPSFGAA